MQQRSKLIDRVWSAFGDCLDRSITQIANGAGYAGLPGSSDCEIPEAHTLNSPSNDESARDSHTQQDPRSGRLKSTVVIKHKSDADDVPRFSISEPWVLERGGRGDWI